MKVFELFIVVNIFSLLNQDFLTCFMHHTPWACRMFSVGASKNNDGLMNQHKRKDE